MGIFGAFLDDDVALIAVEAGGEGIASGRHGASLGFGRPGVLHGSRSYVLQDEDGQIREAHSVSAGLDYPGVGPQLAQLRDAGRITVTYATDAEAVAAVAYLARSEGIIPALESAHAVSEARKLAGTLGAGDVILVNVSGRGDKDFGELARLGAAGDETRP
jgi:tryptophan synthase beta chain